MIYVYVTGFEKKGPLGFENRSNVLNIWTTLVGYQTISLSGPFTLIFP